MCAISGVLLLGTCEQDSDDASRAPVVREALGRAVQGMNQVLQHRGPDDATLYQDGPLTLGHRRLSIIDVSGGRQPLGNEDGSVQVIANGEIYNHRELRALLLARGHHFRTRSDSEVVVHAYEEWGLDALARLRGMFALALYDRPRGVLLLARDPVGEKPLYYWSGPLRGPGLRGLSALCFASEAKGLLALPWVDRAADPVGISDYLRYRYIAAPHTALRGISKLPAGSYLRISAADSAAASLPGPVSYWDLSYRPKLNGGTHLIQRLVEDALDDAVRSRLMADVPLGALLSGGLDSTLVVALMRRSLGAAPVSSFCSGFLDPAFDERPAAAQVARALGTRHHEVRLDRGALDLLPRIVWHLDEPLGDASLLPTFVVAGLAAGHVKAVLTGDGGDESFAGYDRYRRSRLSDLLRALPAQPHGVLRRAVQLVARLWPGESGTTVPWLLKRLAQSERSASVPLPQLFQQSMSAFSVPEVHALLHPDLREAARPALDSERVAALFESADAEHYLDRFLYSDLRSYLADGLMVKSDRMSMAHGLEARAPLLDTSLLVLSAALPVRFKRAPGRPGKQVLRAIGRQLLPRELHPLVLEGKKRGFSPPLSRWLGEDSARVDGLLRRPTLVEAGLLSAEGVAAMLAAPRPLLDDVDVRWESAEAVQTDHRFLLLMLELWHRVVILGEHSDATLKVAA